MRTSAIYCAVLAGLFVLTSGVGLLHAEEAGRKSSGRIEPVVAAAHESGPLANVANDGMGSHDEVLSASEAYGLELAREIEQAFRGRGRGRGRGREHVADTPALEEAAATQSDRSIDGDEGFIFSVANDFQQSVEERLTQRSLFDPDRHETGYKSMVFRFGSGRDASGRQTLTGLDFMSVPVYETGFAFESTVVAVEYQYELLQGNWGLGTSKSCLFDTLSCQWRAIFHLDGGKVLDTVDSVGITGGTDFLRAGVNLRFNFQPKMSPLDRFESQISTYYLEDLTGDSQISSLSEKIVFWRVDNDGELRLRARYYHGDLPLDQDKLSVVTLGLEVKF